MNKQFDPAIGNATRWQKGQPSPNPSGRPRKTILSDALRDILEEPYPRDREGRTYAQVIARRVANEAARGNLRAVAEIADRTEGRVRTENESRGGCDQSLLRADLSEGEDPREALRAIATRLRDRLIASRNSAGVSEGGT